MQTSALQGTVMLLCALTLHWFLYSHVAHKLNKQSTQESILFKTFFHEQTGICLPSGFRAMIMEDLFSTLMLSCFPSQLISFLQLYQWIVSLFLRELLSFLPRFQCCRPDRHPSPHTHTHGVVGTSITFSHRTVCWP